MNLSRRSFLTGALAAVALPKLALTNPCREIDLSYIRPVRPPICGGRRTAAFRYYINRSQWHAFKSYADMADFILQEPIPCPTNAQIFRAPPSLAADQLPKPASREALLKISRRGLTDDIRRLLAREMSATRTTLQPNATT